MPEDPAPVLDAVPVMEAADVPGYIGRHPEAAAITGVVREVSLLTDGKLNDVFLVTGSAGSVVLKQGLPWVRIYPDWPLPAERTRHEARVYQIVGPLVGALAPRLIGYDEAANVLLLEAIADAAPWSEALAAGRADPEVARALGQFTARLAFGTSAFGADAATRAAIAASAGESVLADMMAHLVFTRPFEPDDAHASGQGLGGERVRADRELAAAIAGLGERYLTADGALIHGDLHIASVLVAPGRPVVLDYEFARTGPVGFDLGLLWANILLAIPVAAESPGLAPAASLAGLVTANWAAFTAEFTALAAGAGQSARPVAAWLGQVKSDAIGYAGCEILRRVVSGDLVVPLTVLSDRDRDRAGRALLDLATAAVLRRAELTVQDLADGGAGVT
ncbi:MAG TPA: phosphotransferase [Streptosporangiaceae bacterium]|jgi:5-methylthioribose kinase|nr:phosphotransferase [Streptosporangiaceae bacterium]